MYRTQLILCVLCLLCLIATETRAQVFDEQYSHWPEDLKIHGQIIVVNQLHDLGLLEREIQRSVRGKSVLCLRAIPVSSIDTLEDAVREGIGNDGSFSILSSAKAPANLFAAAIDVSDCVLVESIPGDSFGRLQRPLRDLIQRGGTLIVNDIVADQLGKRFFLGNDESETQAGLNLIPDCFIRLISEFAPDRKQLFDSRSQYPRIVGIQLNESSALLLSGRKVVCFGTGKTTFLLPKREAEPAVIEVLPAMQSRRQNPESYVADLTQWRRRAIDRDLPPFPSAKPMVPKVDRGTLLIVGGGGSPDDLMTRFVELAGGTRNARLVYVPCSENDQVGEQHRLVQSWHEMGIKQATFIHTKDRSKANSDDAFLAPLTDATGIYFGGGRQWNFSDSYYGTKAHELMKDVLKRGGVIAGSSAGASIQARYLARATPIGNTRIMAPGYERGGLGFISGVAIDQHFSQRRRQKDMSELMKSHPQLLGIGIDEATAIEVHESTATVSGRGRVFFYDTTAQRSDEEPDYVALPSGSIYDLAKRRVIENTTEVDAATAKE